MTIRKKRKWWRLVKRIEASKSKENQNTVEEVLSKLAGDRRD